MRSGIRGSRSAFPLRKLIFRIRLQKTADDSKCYAVTAEKLMVAASKIALSSSRVLP